MKKAVAAQQGTVLVLSTDLGTAAIYLGNRVGKQNIGIVQRQLNTSWH